MTLMVVLAMIRLSYEFWWLTSMVGPDSAHDLHLRYNEVQSWFSCRLVYQDTSRPGGYAPASYFMLWPFVGWFDFRQVRWL
jgi:hypothetical protein